MVLSRVAQAYDPSMQEVGESRIQGQPGLHSGALLRNKKNYTELQI
jgi:hypothetical protein